MGDPLPTGCRARYEAIYEKANILLDQFYYGNRKRVQEELSELPPLAAAAVVTIMLRAAQPETQKLLEQWLREVA